MTRIKLCGLTRPEDIAAANALQPEYIGFVFAAKSKRYVSREIAAALKAQLSPEIKAVGVFVNEAPETVAGLLNDGILDLAQLLRQLLHRAQDVALDIIDGVMCGGVIGLNRDLPGCSLLDRHRRRGDFLHRMSSA